MSTGPGNRRSETVTTRRDLARNHSTKEQNQCTLNLGVSLNVCAFSIAVSIKRCVCVWCAPSRTQANDIKNHHWTLIDSVHSRRRKYLCGEFTLPYKDTGKFHENNSYKINILYSWWKTHAAWGKRVVLADMGLSSPSYKYEKSRLRKVFLML